MDSIILDTLPPQGSIQINNGAISTSSTTVTLSLTYVDATSNVSQVRYSNDNVWDTEVWETPALSKSWSLTSGEGTKTVYYQVKDNSGLISSTYSDSITLTIEVIPEFSSSTLSLFMIITLTVIIVYIKKWKRVEN